MGLRILSISIICFFSGPIKGDDATDQLRQIAVNNQANRGSIVTWEGRVSISDKQMHDGEQRSAAYDADYTLDRSSETLRWSFREVSSDGDPDSVGTAQENSKDALFEPPASVTGILSNDGLSRIDTRIVGTVSNMLGIQPANLFTRSYTSWDFDPMYYFDPAGGPAALRIQLVYDMKDNPYSTWKVSKSGSMVTLRSDVNISINEYVVDLNSGSNVVSNLMTERDAAGNLVAEMEWNATFVQVGDIWVPGRVLYEDKHHVNKTNFSRMLEWHTQTVNGTLAEQAFDLAAIGVRDGFTVVDDRTGSLMDVKDGKLIPRIDRGGNVPPNARRYSIWIASISVLIGLALIVFITRRRVSSESG